MSDVSKSVDRGVPNIYLYLVMGLFLATYGVLHLFSGIRTAPSSNLQPLKELPAQFGDWKGADVGELPDEVVEVIGLSDWLLRSYRQGAGLPITLYIGYIGQEAATKTQDHHSPKVCYPGQGWKMIDEGLQTISVSGGQNITIDRFLVQKDQDRQLVLYWFQWGDRIVAEGNWGDYKARISWLMSLPAMLFGKSHRTDRTFVRISAPVVGSIEETTKQEIDFIQSAFPSLSKHFMLNTSAS